MNSRDVTRSALFALATALTAGALVTACADDSGSGTETTTTETTEPTTSVETVVPSVTSVEPTGEMPPATTGEEGGQGTIVIPSPPAIPAPPAIPSPPPIPSPPAIPPVPAIPMP